MKCQVHPSSIQKNKTWRNMGTFLSIFKIMLMRRYNPKFKKAPKLNILVVTAVLQKSTTDPADAHIAPPQAPELCSFIFVAIEIIRLGPHCRPALDFTIVFHYGTPFLCLFGRFPAWLGLFTLCRSRISRISGKTSLIII